MRELSKSSKIIELDWQQQKKFHFNFVIVENKSLSFYSSLPLPFFPHAMTQFSNLIQTFPPHLISPSRRLFSGARETCKKWIAIDRARWMCGSMLCILARKFFYYRAVHCDFSLHQRPPFWVNELVSWRMRKAFGYSLFYRCFWLEWW